MYLWIYEHLCMCTLTAYRFLWAMSVLQCSKYPLYAHCAHSHPLSPPTCQCQPNLVLTMRVTAQSRAREPQREQIIHTASSENETREICFSQAKGKFCSARVCSALENNRSHFCRVYYRPGATKGIEEHLGGVGALRASWSVESCGRLAQ